MYSLSTRTLIGFVSNTADGYALGKKPEKIYGDEAANAKAASTIAKLKWDGEGGMKVDAKGKVC